MDEEIRKLGEWRERIIEADRSLIQLCARLSQARDEIRALSLELDQAKDGE